MPQTFDQIAAAPTKNVKIAGVGIAAEAFLDLERQRVHPAAHVRHPAGQPDPNALSAPVEYSPEVAAEKSPG